MFHWVDFRNNSGNVRKPKFPIHPCKRILWCWLSFFCNNITIHNLTHIIPIIVGYLPISSHISYSPMNDLQTHGTSSTLASVTATGLGTWRPANVHSVCTMSAYVYIDTHVWLYVPVIWWNEYSIAIQFIYRQWMIRLSSATWNKVLSVCGLSNNQSDRGRHLRPTMGKWLDIMVGWFLHDHIFSKIYRY